MPLTVEEGLLAGKYRFIARIGQGGMAEVYLTVMEGSISGFHKLVVIKLLRSDLTGEEDFRQMFLQEARLAARLSHPNVVQTHDVGEDQGRYYMAMDYLDGQSFERIRRARGAVERFSLPMKIHMLTRVLAGLHYAHELTDYDGTPLSVIHRDVTPSNIFVCYNGQVQLVDFGIAKAFNMANETRAGVLKGKTGYMAPEQFHGNAPIDRRIDIFSVGMVLWESLVNARMWKELPPTDRVRLVANGQIQPPHEVAPHVPPELERICLKALSFRPEDRYPTAALLQHELEVYLEAHPPRVGEREVGAAASDLFPEERLKIRSVIDAQLRRTEKAVQIPDLGMFVQNVGGGATQSSMGNWDSLRMSPTGGTQTQAQPSRKRMLLVAGALVAAAALVGGGALLLNGGRHGGKAAAPAAMIPDPQARPALAVRGVSESEIVLGMSAAFSGPSRDLGNRMKLGIDTAFASINDAGGVHGRKLTLLPLDDGYEGTRALENMHELLEKRHVFAVIGNVGTPTALLAAPYAVANRTIFFGAFTGSNILRRDPPDRYVINYRASYEEETAKMIHYLLEVKKIPARSIVVFAQHDAYGDAGYEGAAKTLRKLGATGDLFRANYERNTLDIDAAINDIAEYNAANSVTRSSSGHEVVHYKHPVKAIIMVATYKVAARFIQRIRDRKMDALFLNVSFVGSNSLAEELKELGPTYANGVIVTQVVPHFESGATGVIRYRDALKKFHPDQQPDFISLEGYIVGRLLGEGLLRAGRDVDTEKLVEAIESIQGFDLGVGTVVSFGLSNHQGSHKVWGTVLDDKCNFQSFDME